ncbi:MAG: APC family permease [Coriobacteriia bacterium]
MASNLKSLLLGNPLHNEESQHQRLPNIIALAVFSSDAISSVAYAVSEIIIVLSIAGAAYLHVAWPIAIAIGALMLIVGTSYRQTIRAYPNGGGSYVVAKENLGDSAGLFSGAALLVGYVLTVAVSIASGTAALTSAFPQLRPFTVPIALAFVGILTLGNLRGMKESGKAFSLPTYLFIILMAVLILYGLGVEIFGGGEALRIPSPQESLESTAGSLGLFLVLRAFASGCSAMTGVEAMANGIQAFREPAAKNAAKTLGWMLGIMLFLFLGISWLAVQAGVHNVETETVISQLSRHLFGTGLVYYLMSFGTMAILIIAANTSYAGFPLLASFMAADDFLPHQLKDKGYRLVHSNGIILLAAASAALLIIFGGNTTALVPLYAFGVFMAFTLSQAGMVKHWFERRDEPRWRLSAVINGVGAVTTGLVALIVGVTKFTQGAWIVVAIIPLMAAYFFWVRRRYRLVKAELALPEDELVDLSWQSYNRLNNHVIVLVKELDRRLVRALQYAKTLRADTVEAIYVDISGEDGKRIREAWDKAEFGIRLTIIPSPYREVIGPIISRVKSYPRRSKDDIVTVIIPEYAPTNAADAILHDQTSFWIKQQLFGEDGVIVVDVPYHPSFAGAAKSRTPDAEPEKV